MNNIVPVFRSQMVKKRRKKRPLLILISVLLVLLTFVQFETYMAYEFVFGRRFTTNDDLGLMEYSDFDGLLMVEDSFTSNKGQTLRGGFFYTNETPTFKGLVVLSHGFGGGGYIWYLPQVAYLAQNGYLVYTFDKTGTDLSDGKDVRGLPQGIIDLQYALNHLRTTAQAQGLPILLYGHSWGGYSSCAILQDEKDIAAVASMSSFNSSQDMLITQGTQIFGDYVSFLSPFLNICDKIRFGKYADYTSLKGLSETQVDVILFHSDDDRTIPIETSFNIYAEQLSDKENLTFVPMSAKKHDVYFSDEATKYRVQSRAALKLIRDDIEEYSVDNEFLFYLEFDRAQANAVDEAVMGQVVDFFDASVAKWRTKKGIMQ